MAKHHPLTAILQYVSPRQSTPLNPSPGLPSWESQTSITEPQLSMTGMSVACSTVLRLCGADSPLIAS